MAYLKFQKKVAEVPSGSSSTDNVPCGVHDFEPVIHHHKSLLHGLVLYDTSSITVEHYAFHKFLY